MNTHEVWLWLWFFVGTLTYWMKRAYYLVTGPNPIANTYPQFVQRCWIPILVRAFIDAMAYWVLFIPGMGDKLLAYFGYSGWQWVTTSVTQFAPVAAIFGHTIDSVVDFLVTKIPYVKDVIPQMPPPLKP